MAVEKIAWSWPRTTSSFAKACDASSSPTPTLELVGVCDDLDSLFLAIETQAPHVVVTDIRMPPTGTDEGIRAADICAAPRPNTGVIVLSQYTDPDYALALFEKGSRGRGYLLKERVSELDQLLGAIRDGGRRRLGHRPPRSSMRSWPRGPRASPSWTALRPVNVRSSREIAQGQNNAAIAATLVLSERAVEKHINSIFSKLGLSEEPDVHQPGQGGPAVPVRSGRLAPPPRHRASTVGGPVSACDDGPPHAPLSPSLIVDDQAPFRSAAAAVISATPGFEVVGEADTGEQAVELAASLRPELVLMDINLPGISGIEATRRIIRDRPGIVVILLSTYQRRRPAVRRSLLRSSRLCAQGAVRARQAQGALGNEGRRHLADGVIDAKRHGRGQSKRGIAPEIVVPSPGADCTRRLPPMAPRRSPMLTKPAPRSCVVGSKPTPSSVTSNKQPARVPPRPG